MHILYKLMLAGGLLAAFPEQAPAQEKTTVVAQSKAQKLVHMKSNFTVVEFVGEETVIHDRILEKEMTERGVLIPPALRGLYHGKEAIRLGEEEFQRAFKEIFAVNIFDSASYTWQD